MAIPPSQQMIQAQQMQRSMMPPAKPEDPLLKALSQQQMMGEMMKESAAYKMKMIKLRQKYAAQGSSGIPPQGPQPGGM